MFAPIQNTTQQTCWKQVPNNSANSSAGTFLEHQFRNRNIRNGSKTLPTSIHKPCKSSRCGILTKGWSQLIEGSQFQLAFIKHLKNTISRNIKKQAWTIAGNDALTLAKWSNDVPIKYMKNICILQHKKTTIHSLKFTYRQLLICAPSYKKQNTALPVLTAYHMLVGTLLLKGAQVFHIMLKSMCNG